MQRNSFNGGLILVNNTILKRAVSGTIMRLILTVVVCFTLVKISFGANVLFLYPNCSPSHKNVAVPIMLGLAEKGHNVTVVSSFKTEQHENIRDILPFTNFSYIPGQNALEMRRQGFLSLLTMDNSHLFHFCEIVYNNKEFQELLNLKFDLVVMDAFTNECLLGFIYKTGAPLVIVSPLPVAHHVAEYVGNRLPLSFVPHFISNFGHKMSFMERVFNVMLNSLGTWSMTQPTAEHERVYKRHLGEGLPAADEILRNASMIIVNSHFDFNFPRPTLPDVVEVGAIHCRPGRRLPEDLDEFISDAEHGLILFSLGSVVRPHEMPDESRKVFVNVFSRLKQRILWKWPNEMPDAPPNVKLSTWIPQQDVLAHSNTRLFVTHGGLLSTQESLYHGVPTVYLPVFADQDLNAYRANQAGIGVTVEILGITEEALEKAINAVLNDTSYRNRVAQMSTFLRDQPETPKERAVFWSEYVIRHQGAKHLRSAARHLNFIQYYCLDVVGALAGVAVTLLAVVCLVLVKIVKLLSFLFKGKKDVKDKIKVT